jgi:hypothetical protein
MRVTYECRLRLADEPDRRRARALARRWVGAAYGGWPADAGAGPEATADGAASLWRPAPDARVQWRRFTDPPGRHDAFELTWSRAEHAGRRVQRRTTVRVIGSGPIGEVQVTEALEAEDGRLLPLDAAPGRRPDLIADFVTQLRCVDGGRRLSAGPVAVGVEHADETDAFLRADRCLPVVLVAGSSSGEVRADAARFADELVGLAHTFVVAAPAGQRALAERIGVEWMPEPGGVRLFWPGWRAADPLERHPHWRADDCAGPSGPRPRVAEALTHLVVGAATLWTDAHPLLERLRRAAARAETAGRREALAELRRKMAEDQAVAEELIGEYQRELSRADQRVYELEEALEAAQERTERADAARRDAEERLIALLAEPGRSLRVLDVLKEVAGRARHLRILDRVLDQAPGLHFGHPERLRDALLTLDRVAAERAAGTLNGSFADACLRRGLNWAGAVSETAQQKFAGSYTVTEPGRSYQLGPHLRLNDADGPFRVYCAFDGPVVVVGHVGRHLPDKSSPHG